MSFASRTVSKAFLSALFLAASLLGGGARRRTSSSSWRPPRRPSSRACSRTCCRRSSRPRASTCKVVAVGTGQALDMARRGDADVLFVHDTAAEEKFVAEGFGLKRLPVMYNDFVLVGPEADPAGVEGQGHRRGARRSWPPPSRLRLARRQERHPRRRAALLEGGRQSTRPPGQRRRAGLQGMRLRHGPGAEHRGVEQRLRAGRPRHLAQLQEPRPTWPCWWKATSACSTSTA